MLRITSQSHEDEDSLLLKLEGTLKGLWVDELERVWLSSTSKSPKKLSLDLKSVSFVDDRGRAMLLKMRDAGVVLKDISPFVRQVLAESD